MSIMEVAGHRPFPGERSPGYIAHFRESVPLDNTQFHFAGRVLFSLPSLISSLLFGKGVPLDIPVTNFYSPVLYYFPFEDHTPER